MSTRIDPAEVQFSPFSARDGTGRVFFWRGGVFRAVYKDAVERVNAFFASGLPHDLGKRNLFPQSRITDLVLDGYGLVVQHEFIGPVTYPYEWTFEMVKDAARMVLEVNAVAHGYGYETLDAHGFNILFDGFQPKYVDLGSFIPVVDREWGWRAYEEFMRFFYYPLKIWRDGNEHIARRLLVPGDSLPHYSYFVYKTPLLRPLPLRFLKQFSRLWLVRHIASLKADSDIENRLRRVLLWCIRAAGLHKRYQSSVILPLLHRRIERMQRKAYETSWGDYYSRGKQRLTAHSLTPRLERIKRMIEERDVRTVVDLGSNEGILAKSLLRNKKVRHVTCIDTDENAIETLYQYIKHAGVTSLTPVLQNAIVPLGTLYTSHPRERFKADAVLALALTHHLLISQAFNVAFVLETIASYCLRYAFVEFMPLGLFDGERAPAVPSWYSREWFREEFRRHFEIEAEEELEPNRVLFLGKLRTHVGDKDKDQEPS